MPRSYAKLLTTIWDDADFVALPADAQRLYMLLMSQKDLTLCGTLHTRMKPWARLAADTTLDAIETAFATLCERRFVVLDADTEEALIRTFIRHDGGVNNRNIHKGIENAITRLQSDALRAIATDELNKAAGRTAFEDPSPPPPEHPSKGDGNLPSSIIHQPYTQQPESIIPAEPGSDSTPQAATYTDDEGIFVASVMDIIANERTAAGAKKSPSGYRATVALNLAKERPSIVQMLEDLPHLGENAQLAADWYERSTWKLRGTA